MKPTDLRLFRAYGRPALTDAGDVIAALSTPDVEADRYHSVLHLIRPGEAPIDFTRGPGDSAPVLSPLGGIIVFLRSTAGGPAQPYAMPRGGGEPFQLVDHPLGVSAVTFSPDGRRIAYLAAVPEAGRYGVGATDGAAEPRRPAVVGAEVAGNDPGPGPDSEPARRIDRLSYRSDGKGFTFDRPEQVFVLDLIDANGAAVVDSVPRRLTDEVGPIGRPAFTPDGTQIVYERPAAVDSQQSDIAAVAVSATEPVPGRRLVAARGDASRPIVHRDTVYYIGASFDGHDFAGRTAGLWAAPLAGGQPRRLTDAATVHVDAEIGDPVVVDDAVLVAVADRGAVAVRVVPVGSSDAQLDRLPVLLGGTRVVKAFTVNGARIAAVVSSQSSCGDIVTGDIPDLLRADAARQAAAEVHLTDVSAPLRDAGLAPVVELAATAPDGYPGHGWLVLPPPGRFARPHPVLLSVHGGPHSAHTWSVFDEAQMYATNGYAVVLPNPRGSAGYGEEHGRAIVRRLGTIDAADVLALLDAALARDDLDAGRVGVMGGSYGGFMTSWLAAHAPGRFVAGISERAVNAWDSFAGSSDIGYFFADAYVGSDPAEMRARSPLEYAERIDIPLLIIHSEQDWRCPLEQAQRLFVALKSRRHLTEMLLFPGEGHELSRSGRPKHRQQRFEAILQWWARYLPIA